jgi:two-component system, cell cycle sensor histidine kinase and response regulator CckA
MRPAFVAGGTGGRPRGSAAASGPAFSNAHHGEPPPFERPVAEERPAPTTVLVVEDNPDHAEMITVMLARARGSGWCVDRVPDLGSGLQWLSRQRPDVVLLDLNLPDSRGMDSVIRVCARVPEVPVVVVTAYNDDATGLAAMQSGAQDYLIKGQFEEAILSRTLRFAIERKRAEVAAARLAAIVENSSDGIFSSSLEGVVLTWNHGAELLYGYSAEEACGRSAQDLMIPPERHEEMVAILRRICLGVRVGTLETERRTRDGEPIQVSLSVSPIVDPAGRVTGASVISRDIGDRKRTEEALHARTRQQAAVARLGQMALTSRAATGLMQEAAALVAETLEVDASAVLELLPRRQAFVLKAGVGWSGEVVGAHLMPAGTASQAGYALLTDGPVIAPDLLRETRFTTAALPRERNMASGLSVLLPGRQGPLGVLEVYTSGPRQFTENDVHFLESMATVIASAVERQQAEDDVNRFFALSLEMMAIMDYDGRCRQLNPAWEKTLGVSLDELKADSLIRFAHPDDAPRLRLEWERLCSTGEAVDFEGRFRCLDGSYRSLVWSCRSDPERKLVHAAVRDMTEHRRLEERLLHSQKMDAIGQLAGGVAHDFNNLLGVITGYGDLLMRDMSREDPRCRRVEEIRKAADRAASLTRQLLAFGRKQVLQPKRLDLNAVVANIERMLQRLIGEHIQLVTAYDRALDAVKADQGQIEQVIVNLAVNARDAMPEGGRLILETANVEVGAEQAGGVPGARPGRYALLSVSDTGHGMEAEVLAHVFEPFFTTKAPGKGTGLGLATVYGIVQQSGGYVTAWSEPGRGATFQIFLPRVEAGEEATAPRAAPDTPTTGQETVLVAEDEPALRAIIRETLQSGGYTVLTAADAEEAIALARQHAGPIDIVLSDVVMPRMSGWEAARRIRAERPSVKLLFMSGYTEDALGRPELVAGARELLLKPFTADVLLRRLRDVLDGPSPAREARSRDDRP